LEKASEGKTKSRGGMNMDEIKDYLSSLPGADINLINKLSRLELDTLLFDSLNKEVVTSKVVTSKVVYATDEDLKLDLINTILPSVLINTILSYTETIIKVQFDDAKIVYYSQNEFNDLDCQNITHLDIYGVLVMKDPRSKFQTSNIQTISGPVVLIGDTFSMFYYAMNFNSDISDWGTSKVENMTLMFSNAIKFNSDISGWDTSNVTDMSYMFYNVKNFNSDISRWDTSKVTNMISMFYNAKNFNKDISRWDTSKVTDMGYMFSYATNFNQDISFWDTSKVESMDDMFYHAISFTGSVKKVKGIWKIIYG
jgi:surface protein